MSSSKRIGFQSSLLVNWSVIALSFGLSLLAWWRSADAVASLLLTLAAVGVISRLWGMAALKDLDVTVRAESTVLSVGRSAEVTYLIENNKFLPLVWIELCQDVPKNGCMEPDGSMTLRKYSEEETLFTEKESAYMRRFAFLLGHSEITWSCVWTGKRRGIYRPGDLMIRSGDGFGLTQSVNTVSGLKDKLFVVWPKIVPVRTSALLSNLFSGGTGRSGWAEDSTILRDEREYQEGDNWKRIDWRTAARTNELYTKQYERIRPQSVLIAVETGSFSDPEEALSIAASLLYDLHEKGIAAGLTLPSTQEKEAVLIRPDDPYSGLSDCLYELADHDVSTAGRGSFPLRAIASAAEETAQIWILGESQSSIASGDLASLLIFAAPRYITAEGSAGSVSFSQVRDGGEGV